MAVSRDGGKHRSRGATDCRKASDLHSKFAHAAEVELSQVGVGAEHVLLSERVRWAYYGQGDANLNCRTRNHFRAGRCHGCYECIRDKHDHLGWRN